MKISLFASAVRVQDWDEFMSSLESNKCEYEVIFVGDVKPNKAYKHLTYIYSNVKPAQCYEIARRHCTGDLVHWTADDAVYSPGCLDAIIAFWEKINNPKAVISLFTKENGHCNVMQTHRFFGGFNESPIMAPLGIMRRSYLEELGGIDRRYVCGQYENDIVMRVHQDGGKVEIFAEDHHVALDHKNKHDQKGSTFAIGYAEDRTLLEGSWYGGWNKHSWPKEPLTRYDKFEPFIDKDLVELSQSNCAIWK